MIDVDPAKNPTTVFTVIIVIAIKGGGQRIHPLEQHIYMV